MTRILVIDDAEPLRNDILEMLSFEGFDVRGAENGATGIEEARSFHPDLIVCDVMMPGLNGYDVLETLRQDAQTAAIPFVFLTAKTDRADMRYGMGLGADDYLTKPFNADELLETIRARLHRHEDFKALAENKLKELSESIITALPHELRTPLNTIIGFSDMLMSEAPRLKPELVAEWGQHINSAALRLGRLVENYLAYTRIETLSRDLSKVTALRERSSDPFGIVDFQVRFRADHYERGDDLQFDLQPGIMLRIADHDLSKIVEEVMDNAFKFSPKESPVVVSGTAEGSEFVLVVADNGRGMRPDQINAVGANMQFDRYVHEQQGVGLGLVIAKRLTELYGGQFQLESVAEQGTTITIRLPLA
jgi:signal transduction histidine kinase